MQRLLYYSFNGCLIIVVIVVFSVDSGDFGYNCNGCEFCHGFCMMVIRMLLVYGILVMNVEAVLK